MDVEGDRIREVAPSLRVVVAEVFPQSAIKVPKSIWGIGLPGNFREEGGRAEI